MRALASIIAIIALGCAGAAKRQNSLAPKQPKARRLTVDAIAGGTEITTGAELMPALLGNRRPFARLVEIVEMKWRDHTFDREVLGDMISGNYEYETRERFKARFGLDYDKVFRVFLFGYGAQLAERFGLVPREMNIADDKGRWLVNVWGRFDGQLVEWKSGVFALRGPDHSIVPTPPPKTIETVLISENEREYSLSTLGTNALFKPRGNEQTSDRLRRGEVLRTYLETVEYVDANGRRFNYPVPIDRPTPFLMVRPGGLAGLTESLHIVRVELDQTAQPGSQILIASYTVLDGTKDIAPLGPAYKPMWTRFNNDRLAAMAKIAQQVAAQEAAFTKAANEWARKQSPPGKLVTEHPRTYNQTQPKYSWDPTAKTLTITFQHKHSVIVLHKIGYPNPEMQNFRCAPGVPCAVPPDEAFHVLEQRYDVLLDATYQIDRDAKVTLRELEGPRIQVVR